MKLTTQWKGGLGFDSTIGPHTVRTDARVSAGGEYSGPTPKELVLAGLCGCTGIDVALIVKKMRQEMESLEIDAEAEQSDGNPAVFTRIKLIYCAKGANLTADKLKQAVDFSQSKYCGVSAMIAKTAKIEYTILLNGQEVATGEAKFS